ncbi:UNVERIFIED_CONTAM: hypothetical protein PYX00_008800 [Menopon gallinae]|uniref:Uncharacterized protein n=1 Tax=Menopon gallinae TaxID=328185 RepID=A0AAW2HQ90_9NEOP
MDVNRCIDDTDRDFEYGDRNRSHKWLFSYPGKLMPTKNEISLSLTKEVFGKPVQKSASTKGKRKKILENFYRQIIAEELKSDFDSEKAIIEPYETDYTEHYKHPDDMPLPGECLSKNEQLKMIAEETSSRPDTKNDTLEELKTKYPLYASRPYTFAAQTIGKDRFGIKSTISKPPEQNYDNIEY